MKHLASLLISVFLLGGIFLPGDQGLAAERKGGYILPGDVKEGWNVYVTKKCNLCHAIWGEGGKGGPDLGVLPESYVSPAQLTALMWNHGPEMWAKMQARKVTPPKMTSKEMADLFAFLYFIRYMDEPGDPLKGKSLIEIKACIKCHALKDRKKDDLNRWGMYVNPILWAQMMWNHAMQMEDEMKRKGISRVEFKGNEMIDLIAYIRSSSPTVERIYLSPGDPTSGEGLFTRKGCIVCHTPGKDMDLARRRDFPKTPAQMAGTMWNHAHVMWKGMKERGMAPPELSDQEMADVVAYLISIRYFDEPGSPERGKTVFTRKQCNLCHAKDSKKQSLVRLKGQISPILMAQALWNHGPEMLEEMKKAKVSWQKIDAREMVDLMEYLNRGTP
jgi:cytochrome c2